MDVQRSPRSPRYASERVLLHAASRGERLVSMARALFSLAILLRSLVVRDAMNPGAMLLGMLPLVLAILFSGLVLAAGRRGPLSPRWLLLSVMLDWSLCLSALGANVLWSWPGYPGIIMMPDVGVVYLMIFSSVFRLSPPAVLLSGVLNASSCVILFVLDHRYALAGHPWNFNPLSLVLLACVGATGIAFAMAWWTRRLVLHGATESWRRTRVRRTLNALMEDGHGIRSLLSAAKLTVDHLATETDGMVSGKPLRRVRELQSELSELVRLTARTRDRAFAALADLEAVPYNEVPRIAEGVCRLLSRQFPHVAFDLTGEVGKGNLAVVGGQGALERILLNVLTNACEGDGELAARHVQVAFACSGVGLTIAITDDGPGFAERDLTAPPRCATSKKHGTGIGLFLVSRLMRESGGELLRNNVPAGGARVELSFRPFDANLAPGMPAATEESRSA